MGFSFFYTEKTVSVIKDYDNIMIELKKIQNKYKKNAVEAIIRDNTIIPGISGEEIDLNKSYNKMKRYGSFEESLICLKKIKPKNILKDNNDKYVIGSTKNNISIIFLVEENDNIDEIIKILDKKNVKGNFFVDLKWLEKNSNLVTILVREGHVIGNLSNNMDYSDNSFLWMETVIEKIGKQKKGYCYVEEKNKDILKICQLNDNYTIIPTIISTRNFYSTIKSNLASGSIISVSINNELIEELPVIINYIKSRGYKIENLNDQLKE